VRQPVAPAGPSPAAGAQPDRTAPSPAARRSAPPRLHRPWWEADGEQAGSGGCQAASGRGPEIYPRRHDLQAAL